MNFKSRLKKKHILDDDFRIFFCFRKDFVIMFLFVCLLVIYFVFISPYIGSINLFQSISSSNDKIRPPNKLKVEIASIKEVKQLKTIIKVNNTTQHLPRLLYMTASYTMKQFLYLQKSLDVMKDHCNNGWNVTIHLQVSNGFNESHPRYYEIRNRLYCISINQYIPLIIENYSEIGFGLNSRHRVYLKEHIYEYDYFIYGEEDMILTVSILTAHINAMNVLKSHLPNTWIRYNIGLLRYFSLFIN